MSVVPLGRMNWFHSESNQADITGVNYCIGLQWEIVITKVKLRLFDALSFQPLKSTAMVSLLYNSSRSPSGHD